MDPRRIVGELLRTPSSRSFEGPYPGKAALKGAGLRNLGKSYSNGPAPLQYPTTPQPAGPRSNTPKPATGRITYDS